MSQDITALAKGKSSHSQASSSKWLYGDESRYPTQKVRPQVLWLAQGAEPWVVLLVCGPHFYMTWSKIYFGKKILLSKYFYKMIPIWDKIRSQLKYVLHFLETMPTSSLHNTKRIHHLFMWLYIFSISRFLYWSVSTVNNSKYISLLFSIKFEFIGVLICHDRVTM